MQIVAYVKGEKHAIFCSNSVLTPSIIKMKQCRRMGRKSLWLGIPLPCGQGG